LTNRGDRPALWLHDRDSFYKYTTRDAALAILNNRSLRWSSPKNFNDPFDMQFDLQGRDAYDEVRQRALDALWDAHYSLDEIPVGNQLGQVINAFRSKFPELSRREFNREFGEALDKSLQASAAGISETNSKLKELIEDTKILCLSESHTSVLMWSHYAELHRGVVLEIACIPELDSVWGVASPVSYSDEMPLLYDDDFLVYDDDFLVKLLSGQLGVNPNDVIKRFTTSKAKDWSYEREWRVVLHRTDPSELTQDIRFQPKELAAIYFGCRMAKSDKEEIAAKIGQDYRGTKIFEARKVENKFALRFEEYKVRH
jgi:hypothetical protein